MACVHWSVPGCDVVGCDVLAWDALGGGVLGGDVTAAGRAVDGSALVLGGDASVWHATARTPANASADVSFMGRR